ncbi:MAG: NADH-quinone oxidoreductase subunit J [bacterium]|nr:NADH-quinone oxidoreductase subunit J [bacterium]MBU1917355.1 NADH-quinone oxidoreductase subunit J [bacterium]
MENIVLTIIFTITIGSACVVAFSRNLIYSAFALFGTFLGVAATFIMLGAPFVGLVQIVVYAGGILILTIFAVMLTAKIKASEITNPVLNIKIAIPLFLLTLFLLVYFLVNNFWSGSTALPHKEGSIVAIGNALLTEYLLPFELISIVLLITMIGAAIITRRQLK